MLASILLLDRDGVHLRHGAAPSLPAAYSQAIDGVSIGPNVGSCGTAAYLRKPVVVSDISTDPLWADFKDLAGRHGLRACWSSPILSPRRSVLGTFALYYRHSCTPEPDDEAMITILTRTAALAIEHHQAELELAESEDRFRSLTRCAPIGVFMTDAAGAFEYVNPRFVDISGFEYEKTIEYWLEMASGRTDVVDGWRKAVDSRAEYAVEFAIGGRGPDAVVGMRAAPMRSRTGTWLGYVGTLEDMSERVRRDNELRQESSLRRAIEESIPMGIATVSPDGVQTYVNRAFSEMVGWTPGELVGRKPPFAYWPEKDSEAINRAFAATLNGQATRSGFNVTFRRKSGEDFDALVKVAPLLDDAGGVSGWVASVADTSDQKSTSAV